MQCRSLGFATDLAILELGGSSVERRSGYWRICSPHAPTYYWGNFLLVDALDGEITAEAWKRCFGEELPAARHFALGVDDPQAEKGDATGFAELGDGVDMMTVLTCSPSDLVGSGERHGDVRPLVDDRDWDQALDLGVATRGDEFAEASYRTFFSNYLAMQRAIVSAGRGAWWGAFSDGCLVSQCGIIDCGSGLARYQMVSTHPEFRRQGFASKVVASAGTFAATDLGAEKLVIVADPTYHAISIYRALGFAETEQMLTIEKMVEIDGRHSER